MLSSTYDITMQVYWIKRRETLASFLYYFIDIFIFMQDTGMNGIELIIIGEL
jgi:hypothetical protein